MNKKLDEYRAKFGEQFPLMLVQGMEDREIIKIIDECLESGKPYEPDLDSDTVY